MGFEEEKLLDSRRVGVVDEKVWGVENLRKVEVEQAERRDDVGRREEARAVRSIFI